jgi:hypothetical protein
LKAQLKSASVTDDERRSKARQLAVELGGPDAVLTEEERASVRNLLMTPNREERTYAALSDTSAANFVPTDFYAKLSAALKKADALFDDSVTTPLYTDNGAPMSAAFVNDTGTSAAVVTENTQSLKGQCKTGHSRPGTLDVVPIGDFSCKSHF